MQHVSVKTWKVHFLRPDAQADGDPLLDRVSAVLAEIKTSPSRPGRPFLLDPEGNPHIGFNAFFASPRMRNRASSTNRKYAFALRTWLNFLELRNQLWNEATEDDLFDYRFWRRTDTGNPRPVAGSTWRDDLAAIAVFYAWAERRGPTVLGGSEIFAAGLHGNQETQGSWTQTGTKRRSERGRASATRVRRADVKWFTPGAFRRWRDVGILGLNPDGQERARWRPRSMTRDAAFVEGLYGTGLRLQEWASVLLVELRSPSPNRNYTTLELADACAKRGHGHPYWIKRDVLDSIANYLEVDRPAAIRRAQAAGAYENVRGLTLVLESREGTLITSDGASHPTREVSLNELTPVERLSLFTETDEGLAPMALWLNEDGMPRGRRSWYKAFNRANSRVQKAGIERLQCHPHILRHSFALRWYAVGRLAWERKIGHLSQDEARDFRDQFGDTWSLVQSMLGHADVNTTKNIYLEPFRGLDIKLLLEHGAGELHNDAVFNVLSENPRVRVEGDSWGGIK